MEDQQNAVYVQKFEIRRGDHAVRRAGSLSKKCVERWDWEVMEFLPEAAAEVAVQKSYGKVLQR